MTIHINTIGKQTTSTSCGAFAFAALALATKHHSLETTIIHNPIPENPNFARFAFINKSFTLTSGSEYALELHNVTGNLYLDPTTPSSQYRYLQRYQTPDYNSPAALVAVAATTPATQITVTVNSSFKTVPIYNREVASINLARIGKTISLVEDTFSKHTVTSGRAFLLAVAPLTATALFPTHWLAFGDNHKYYDPASGIDSNMWDTSKDDSDSRYKYAGIKIEVW